MLLRPLATLASPEWATVIGVFIAHEHERPLADGEAGPRPENLASCEFADAPGVHLSGARQREHILIAVIMLNDGMLSVYPGEHDLIRGRGPDYYSVFLEWELALPAGSREHQSGATRTPSAVCCRHVLSPSLFVAVPTRRLSVTGVIVGDDDCPFTCFQPRELSREPGDSSSAAAPRMLARSARGTAQR